MPSPFARLRHLAQPFIFVLFVAGGFALVWWRCKFGFDGFDEPFMILPGFKLYALGDKPFLNEILSGPRQHDLLNYYLVRPWLPYSLLAIRHAAVVVYAALLLLFTLVCFGSQLGSLGLMAGLVYFGSLTFDFFLMPTWSYNWWCRDAFLLHHTLLFLAFKSSKVLLRKIGSLLAGAVMAIAVLAYNPVGVAVAGALLITWLIRRKSAASPLRKMAIPYLVGLGALLFLDVAFIIGSHLFTAWVIALRTVTAERYDGALTLWTKIVLWGQQIFLTKEFWFLTSVAIVLVPVRWISASWFKRSTAKTWKGLAAASLLYMVWKLGLLSDPVLLVRNFYVPMGAMAAIYLLVRSLVEVDDVLVFTTLTASLTAFGMGIVSVNGPLVAYFLVPLLLIPFFAMWVKENISSWNRTEKTRRYFAHAIFLLSFLIIDFGSYRFVRTGVYRDFDPDHCLGELTMAPLEGIHTNRRRAFVLNEVAKVMEHSKFALAFNMVPSVFLFSKVRSSADSVLVDSTMSTERNERTLKQMLALNRLPDVIFLAKIHPWSWGGVNELMPYPPQDTLLQFAECAKSTLITRLDEFEAYSVDAARVAPCAEKAIKEPPLQGEIASTSLLR